MPSRCWHGCTVYRMAGKPATTPRVTAQTARQTAVQTNEYRGQRLGLPSTGPGSLGATGRRLAALAVDWAISYGLAYLMVGKKLLADGQFAALSLLAVCYLVGLAINGATFGMAIFGLRVRMLDGGKPTFFAIVMRTVLLFLVIPPVVWDQDGRGLHDLLAKTLIVSTR